MEPLLTDCSGQLCLIFGSTRVKERERAALITTQPSLSFRLHPDIDRLALPPVAHTLADTHSFLFSYTHTHTPGGGEREQQRFAYDGAKQSIWSALQAEKRRAVTSNRRCPAQGKVLRR